MMLSKKDRRIKLLEDENRMLKGIVLNAEREVLTYKHKLQRYEHGKACLEQFIRELNEAEATNHLYVGMSK